MLRIIHRYLKHTMSLLTLTKALPAQHIARPRQDLTRYLCMYSLPDSVARQDLPCPCLHALQSLSKLLLDKDCKKHFAHCGPQNFRLSCPSTITKTHMFTVYPKSCNHILQGKLLSAFGCVSLAVSTSLQLFVRVSIIRDCVNPMLQHCSGTQAKAS